MHRMGTQVPNAQIVFRVPSAQLNTALDQVKKGAVDVQDETLSGQDITSQYVDLQSRLTAKEAEADQLTKIMQNATKTQDVLDVYEQLQQVDSDIEVMKGQIQYDQQAAQLSAITVHVVAAETIKPIQVGGWKPQGTARDAIQNLVYFWQGFVRFPDQVLPVGPAGIDHHRHSVGHPLPDPALALPLDLQAQTKSRSAKAITPTYPSVQKAEGYNFRAWKNSSTTRRNFSTST